MKPIDVVPALRPTLAGLGIMCLDETATRLNAKALWRWAADTAVSTAMLAEGPSPDVTLLHAGHAP